MNTKQSFHTIKSILNLIFDSVASTYEKSFHTIKSILNIIVVNTSVRIHEGFHTIKSILNVFYEGEGYTGMVVFILLSLF